MESIPCILLSRPNSDLNRNSNASLVAGTRHSSAKCPTSRTIISLHYSRYIHPNRAFIRYPCYNAIRHHLFCFAKQFDHYCKIKSPDSTYETSWMHLPRAATFTMYHRAINSSSSSHMHREDWMNRHRRCGLRVSQDLVRVSDMSFSALKTGSHEVKTSRPLPHTLISLGRISRYQLCTL
jgi:hypothetical protein